MYSFDVLRAKVLYGAGRNAYHTVRPRIRSGNSSVQGSPACLNMNNIVFTKENNSIDYLSFVQNMRFGVDMIWLEKEIDSGRFFRESDENED